jgi:S-(hydroxymethyl)glutathione dehydrogenase/alcohol dehydrogenase
VANGSTMATAIVTNGYGSFALAKVELGPPQDGEVLIQLKASGVCHTDLDSLAWKRRLILGHEGAGVVIACGENVPNVRAGDRVLLNWAIPCGTCFQCRDGAENLCEQKPSVPSARFRCGSDPISPAFGLGTMSTHTVVPWQAVVRIDIDIPFPSAALLGCGVMTGFGSVVNAAHVEKGSSVVVLGTGGVGLSVIQGAAYACSRMIIAVDVNPDRLILARQFGATHTLQADRNDVGLRGAAQEVKAMTGRGADYAFECTAVPELAAAPLSMIRNGGTAIAVSGVEQVVAVDMELFEWDKRYINPLYGQCQPARDFPLLLSLYEQGRLKLDEMVTRTYPLSGLADAFEHMKQGINAKGVLVPDDSD